MRMEELILGGMVVLTLGLGGPKPAAAALPDDQIVQYVIREDPGDDDSAVVFGFEFTLHAVGTDGGSVEWELTQLVLIEVDSDGAAAADWEDAWAAFDTTNGTWWVAHADPQSPTLAEFADPPVLNGTAQASDPADADLDYTIEGTTCDSTCQQMFDGDVAVIDYDFTETGQQSPRFSGIDESVAVEIDELPPYGT
ncbi:MAG: hypothetical protein GY778_08065 [bacterium]|nr:hypothetical protein [bacterium]